MSCLTSTFRDFSYNSKEKLQYGQNFHVKDEQDEKTIYGNHTSILPKEKGEEGGNKKP